MSFFETLLSLVFPDRCVACATRGCLLCATCARALSPAPSSEHPAVLSLFAYRDPVVRKLVRLLKYKNSRHVASICGPGLAALCRELVGEGQFFISEKILVVPVPLARGRLARRGYNQSELLAKAMLDCLRDDGVQMLLDSELLEKRFETMPQAEIANRNARLTNLDSCFAVREGRACQGETILLIDDVTTTGATLAACRDALARAGFARVFALTVAH